MVKNKWSYTITSPYPFMVCKGRNLHFYSLVVRLRTPSINLPHRVDCPRHTYAEISRLSLCKRAGAQQIYGIDSLHPPGRSATAAVLRRTVEGTPCALSLSPKQPSAHTLRKGLQHTHIPVRSNYDATRLWNNCEKDQTRFHSNKN